MHTQSFSPYLLQKAWICCLALFVLVLLYPAQARPAAPGAEHPDAPAEGSCFIETFWARAPGVASPAAALEGASENTDAQDDLVLIVLITPAEDAYFYACGNEPGGPTRFGLFADHESGTHADIVMPEVRCPQGVVRHDRYTGKDSEVHAGRTPFFIPVPAGQADALRALGRQDSLALRIMLLLCTPANCTPVHELVPRALPDGPVPLITETPWAGAWQSAKTYKALPPRSTNTTAVLLPPDPALAASLSGRPFQIVRLPAVDAAHDADGAASGTGASAWHFSPRPAIPGAEPGGAGKAILWGIVAGLILNVMPCVLPVLTLKMTALLGAGSARGRERIRLFREHNVYFAAGIMVWFMVLAAFVGGLDLAWGGLFQYQTPVALMAVLTGVLMLSMFNLCTLPAIDLKPSGTSSKGRAFANGLTATLLATPCSGPLLGGVLAWSALQPPHMLVAVFLSTGLGMALPYLLLAIWPKAAMLLPRPGRWLFVVERMVGVFLFGTTLYLLSVLPTGLSLIICGGLAVLAFCLAARRAKQCGWGAMALLRMLLLLLLAGSMAAWVLADKPLAQYNEEVWEAYDRALLSGILGNEPVLLEFTAEWCPNCKALELTTLTRPRLNAWKKTYGLRLVRVDMTQRDEDTEALLRSLGSISIPLTAIFPKGDRAREPLILRDIYSPAALEAALETLDSL